MKIKKVSSINNKQIKWIKKLQTASKERHREEVYIVEGKKQISELSPKRIHTLIVDEKVDLNVFQEYEGETLLLTSNIFQSISLDKTPQGYMAIVRMEAYKFSQHDVNKNGLYLVLESIQDPGNMGTMIRICDAVKADGLIYNRESVDIFHPKVVKSTVGSLERVKCFQVQNLSEAISKLQENNISVYGASLDNSNYHYSKDYCTGTAFVIGNEGNGISSEVIKMVDARIKIPILGGAESLNAAVASGVLLYEATRQRMQ